MVSRRSASFLKYKDHISLQIFLFHISNNCHCYCYTDTWRNGCSLPKVFGRQTAWQGLKRLSPEEITAITGSWLLHSIGHRAWPNCVLLLSNITIKFLHIIYSLDMDYFGFQPSNFAGIQISPLSWYLWTKHIKLSEPLALRLVLQYSLPTKHILELMTPRPHTLLHSYHASIKGKNTEYFLTLSVLVWMLTDTGTVLDRQSRQSYRKHVANDPNCFPRDVTCSQMWLMAFVPSSRIAPALHRYTYLSLL